MGQVFPKEAARGQTLQSEVTPVKDQMEAQKQVNAHVREMTPTPRGHWRDTFDWLKEAIWEESKKANEGGGDGMVCAVGGLSARLD